MPIDFPTVKYADPTAFPPATPASTDAVLARTSGGTDRSFLLGNLAGIAGLTAAADLSVYYTGSAWATYTVTSVGRTLLAAPTQAAQRTAMGAADDTAVVHNTGAENISGVKTLSDRPIFSAGVQFPADQTAQWSTAARIHATFRGALISSVDNGIFAAGSTASPGRFSFRTQGNSSNVNQVSIEADGTLNFTTGIRPFGDNAADIGTAALRVRTYYGVNSAINTSDARLKTEPRQLSDAECKAGSELARLPAIWEWLTGDRLHAGPTVQAAMTVMKTHGLDPFAYSFICYDEWQAEAATHDDEGNELTPAREAGDRYSFRKEELLCFMVSALAAENDAQAGKIEALDARLSSLEAKA